LKALGYTKAWGAAAAVFQAHTTSLLFGKKEANSEIIHTDRPKRLHPYAAAKGEAL